MKKIFISILIIVVPLLISAQTILFHENFEAPFYSDSVTSSQTATNTTHWAISSTLFSSGASSDSCQVLQNDTTYLTTDAFSTLGHTTIHLEFDHICKIEFFDAAEIEVSNNNGASWTKLIGSQYNGPGHFSPIGNKFASVSYIIWTPAYDTIIPTNSWWKHETFTISSLVSNSAQVKVRFALCDLNNTGNAGNYGWLIDDIKVSNPTATTTTDAGVLSIINPLDSTIAGSNINVQITIQNFGTDTLYSIPVSYQLNTQTQISEIWTGTLLPDSSTNYTFTTSYNALDSAYTLCSWTSLTNDIYSVNDSSCKNVGVIPAPIDVGIISFIIQCSTPNFGPVTVKATIKNFGANTISSIPVEYKYGINSIKETWTGILLPDSTKDYTFNTIYMCPLGPYNLCVLTNLIDDIDSTNNKYCKDISGINENGIDNFKLLQNIPNPTKGITNIVYIIPNSGKIKFELINLLGKIVYSQENKANSGKNQIELNVRNLPSGMYYYSLKYKGKTLSKKMIIN